MADAAQANGLFGLVQKTLLGDWNTSNHFLKMSENLVSSFTPMITVGLGIYIILQAYHYYGKGLDESILDISRRMVGWILIAMFCLNASNYLNLAELIYKAPEAVASALTGKEFSANVLDSYWFESEQEFANITTIVQKFGIDDIARAIACVIMLLFFKVCVFIILGLMFVFYLIAKLSLMLILVVGPIFIACFFFPATRGWASNWLNQVMNYIITITLYVAVIAFQHKVFEQFIKGIFAIDTVGTLKKPAWYCVGLCDKVDAGGVLGVLLAALPTFLLTTTLCVVMIFSVPSIANALMGGNAISANGRSMATVGTALTGGAKAIGAKLLKGIITKGK